MIYLLWPIGPSLYMYTNCFPYTCILIANWFNVYIIYILMSLARVCVVYVAKEVASFWGALSINRHGT